MGAEAIDEEELEDELEKMQQEELTNKMLDTGTVPVNDKVNRLPTGPVSEGETLIRYLCIFKIPKVLLTPTRSKRESTSPGRRRRRRVAETTG